MSQLIRLAESDEAISACFPVMRQLRPQFDAETFLSQVRRQQQSGYRLAYVSESDRIAAVAGFRISECLAWGRFLYVDDLVTDETVRSRGCGSRLLAWLIEQARAAGCGQLHLDSGVQRFDAHRFYLAHRMQITSHHFAVKLG